MSKYYVNTKAQANGDHEVHKDGCSRMPLASNRHYLGEFSSCRQAVEKAKQYFSTSDGCYYCCKSCHTS